MKKFALTMLVTLGCSVASLDLFARDDGYDDRSDYRLVLWGSSRLDSEINHLNRMLGHVRWEIRRYHANWQIRQEYARIRGEAERVNSRFQQRDYDRRQLRREIARLHSDLHNLEIELHARTWDYYSWR
jgi:hypothetical protein